MDTRTASKAKVDAGLAVIKAHMPETYKEIQQRAQAAESGVFATVRRGLAGEPNCFYAFERGHVVGTPFNLVEVARDVAQAMVTFGCAYVCIFPILVKEHDGAH